MNALFILAVPLVAAALLAALKGARISGLINAAASSVTLLGALSLLVARPAADGLIVIDDLNVVLVVLTAFIGCTTAWFSIGAMAQDVASAPASRFYPALYQALIFALLLALVANNIVLMWVAIEMATLIGVMLVALHRTRAAIAAAWKYLILGSIGIALALFGTILMALAAQPVIGDGVDALAWTRLRAQAAGFDAGLLDLAFVFLLGGYGIKAGLVPLHGWVADAHAEAPAPIAALLSGLVFNVALYAVLRFKMILAGNPAAFAAGPLMLALGMASILLPALMLHRRRDIRRFFAYASIMHRGVIMFAFGIGGAVANFAGLLHMVMHGLIIAALCFAIGPVAQAKDTHRMARITGLTVSHPALGWALVLGVACIAGLPPGGMFMSEFLLVTATIAAQPWLVVPLAIGLAIGFGALIRRVTPIAFGAPTGPSAPVTASLAPLTLHLGLVVIAGIWLPPPLVAWFRAVAVQLGP